MMTKKTRGILLIISSAFFFALMMTFVRLSGDISSVQKSFFRNIVAAIFALFVLLKKHQPLMWQKGGLPFLLIRAGFGTLGILCNFYAIDRLVLSDASMLNKLSPFFAIVFSLIFLKEKVKPFQVFAVIIAFVGSLFIIKPSFSALSQSIPSIAGFLGGMFAGIAYTAVRHLGNRGENGTYIVFFFSVFSCLSVLPYLIINYQPMSPLQLLYLTFAGLSAAGGQFTITAAYTNSPAREISVFDYSQIVFTAIIGFFIFGQTPDIFSVIGYVIICGISIIMFFYTNKQTE